MGASNSAPADPKQPQDYSSEPEIYLVRLNQLSDLHNTYRFDECRKGCLDLLAETDLSLFTRIMTLQMAASVSQPVHTQAHLDKAASFLEKMDADMEQVRLLKIDNDLHFSDLESWIRRNGWVGLPLEMLRRGELGGPHGGDCACDGVVKADDAGTCATKEGQIASVASR